MKPPEHELPERMISDLASGRGGTAATRRLVAIQRTKHTVLVWGVVERAARRGGRDATWAREAFELLAAVQEKAPEAVSAVLLHPPVGAWARHTLGEPRGRVHRKGAGPGYLASMAAAAAIRASTPCSLDVPVAEGAITLPTLGRMDLRGRAESETARVVCDGSGARVIWPGGELEIPPEGDMPHWQGVRRLGAACDGSVLDVMIDDLDPYRLPGSPVADRLDPEEARRWQEMLQPAWELLVREHPGPAGDVSATLRTLTPLVAPRLGMDSVSCRDTFGCVGLSTPPEVTSMALTLVHEVWHGKLSALLDVVPLLEPDDGSLHYAPWRPDPRPLGGLLQGMYAHLGITGFWMRRRQHAEGTEELRAQVEFARWREATRLSLDTLLSSGRLTTAGKTFVTAASETLRPWLDEPVPAAAVAIAGRQAAGHRRRWLEQYGRM
jgi:HEXXH motif-containing protein